jgi:hypothetical protein
LQGRAADWRPDGRMADVRVFRDDLEAAERWLGEAAPVQDK